MFRNWRFFSFPLFLLLANPVHGAPIERVTNGDFSAGNTGFTTQYINGNCVAEGHYMVLPNPNTCHSAWGGQDHTTGSGNFMAVNGSQTAGSVVWSQVIAVVPNSVYEFRAWVSSIHLASPATLVFSINGSPIGSIAAPTTLSTWIEFSASWPSEGATSAILRIVDTNLVLFGNDFGLDDISFVGESPTPTLQHSWGQLKVVYR